MVRASLGASLAFNTAGLALLIEKIRSQGGIRHAVEGLRGQQLPTTNYPKLAHERFGWLPRTPDDVVFLGDSHLESVPVADLVTHVKQLGISGQSIADVRSWVCQVLATPPRKLVFLTGTTDALRDRSPMEFARAYDELLDEIEYRAPATKVVVLTVPPLTGPASRRVLEFNCALGHVVARHRCRLIDLHGPLADETGALNCDYTDDGVRLNARGYAQAARVFAAAAGVG